MTGEREVSGASSERILFVLPRMVAGGVERVTLSLVRGFSRRGDECMLALRRGNGEFMEEALESSPVEVLAEHTLIQFVPNLASLLRRWKPTCVITAFNDVAWLTWMAMRWARLRPQWIHCVHNTHASVGAQPGWHGRMRHRFDQHIARTIYARADTIVAVSTGIRDEIVSDYSIPGSRVKVIYNPVVELAAIPPKDPSKFPGQAGREVRLVALGRLVRQKGFDVLINAMACLSTEAAWTLDIWGDGPERDDLHRQIRRHGLEARIRLRGYTQDPMAVLSGSDIFVLSSRHEGLPTALIEALACQAQVVATNCPHGPREILESGGLGRLVPPEDPLSLAQAISDVIDGRWRVEPSRLLERASAFSIDEAMRNWETLIETTKPS